MSSELKAGEDVWVRGVVVNSSKPTVDFGGVVFSPRKEICRPVEQKEPWSGLKDALFGINSDVLETRFEVKDLCAMTVGLMTLSVLNFFMLLYCVVSVYQIKHSTTINRAVQMEALQ